MVLKSEIVSARSVRLGGRSQFERERFAGRAKALPAAI
jgi:hypothetical protein